MYRKLHRNDPDIFAGRSIHPHVSKLREIIRDSRPSTLLDYGSGKGLQYEVDRVHARWGGLRPVCYDVGVKKFAKRPRGLFDGIICTDVMEHIEPWDVEDVLADVFSFLDPRAVKPFVFFSICCRLARKVFPDGRNLHRTVKPPAWWEEQLSAARPKFSFRLTVVYTGTQDDDHTERKVLV